MPGPTDARGLGVYQPPAGAQAQAQEDVTAKLHQLGPGYIARPRPGGGYDYVLADPARQAQYEAGLTGSGGAPAPAPAPPSIPTVDTLRADVAQQQPVAPMSLGQRLTSAQGQGIGGGFGATPALSRQTAQTRPLIRPELASRFALDLPAPGTPGGATPEELGPDTVDRARIDALLGNVSKATSGLQGLAAIEDEYSAGQAQLAQGLDQSQRQALALARSGNRRDSASLTAQALQTGAELSAQATQSSALLRAQEEDAANRLRLDAFTAAGELGLNASALEVDVERINMQAATSYLNQLFETDRLGMQLDEAEAARITGFVRDMALIAKDYYGLSMVERASVRDDLTRRYGIDQQVAQRMAELDAQPGFWEQAALGLVSGAGSALTAGGAKLMGA